ncbi:glycerophosphodiester phosphodiesterase family protein [Pedobacter alluvionis]|uniref:Glycerophosphodiester phosphodiesterase family protein n=1 Tax=Pedobacter alluvionis TaxID=475253 RepID=A0A497YB95_9SPHI|nr:glycerophosphodiester phosphodiesterase family protein [Pedobacter alluvionis]RLJ79958.1 glycerophosphoryl diester phosphodiesterase [Pedobacter alluvionis]TFB31260.1 glycerophosphodiester phosphodiesterase family protein [Pedobacter alluvionis]
MKFHHLLFLVIVAVFISYKPEEKKHHYIKFNTPAELHQFLKWSPENRFPLISAHRGGPMPGFPENCIETFDNATTYNPVIIEFDIAYSKDSVMVIMHDDRLDRTSTGKGPIGNYTYEELKAFNLKDEEGKETKFKIPTLDSVLSWSKGKVLLTIDLKKGVSYAKVIEKVRQYKVESNSIIITYTADQAKEVHHLAPDLMISASVQKKAELKRLNNIGIPNNRIVAFVGVSAPDKELYEYLHNKGITTILGTMGNIDKSAIASPVKNVYYHLVNNGADILSGDNLQQASDELDKFRYNKKLSSPHIN